MMKKAKQIKNKVSKSVISSDNEMSKLLILILVVALIFILFYVITLFVTDDKNTATNSEENIQATIQYEKILAGNIFSQKNDEYYVLVYFEDDKFIDLYKNYLAYYSAIVDGAVPYYYVDMNDVFNNNFISDVSSLSSNNVSDLKFSQTTLLRIRNHSIVSTYEGKDNITGKLDRMTK